MREVIVLVGAHKTASTHLQRSLQDAEALLRQRGIGLLVPKFVRREILPLTYRLRDGEVPAALRAQAEAAIRGAVGTPERLVVMDENIIGGSGAAMLMKGERLYPWAAGRLARLLALMPEGRRQVGMAIRGQAGFLVSMHAESLHHGAYCGFRDYLGGGRPEALSWAEMVGRLRDAIAPVPVTLWRYEDYPAVFGRVTAAFLGAAAQSVTARPEPERVGLSAAAITALGAEVAAGRGGPETLARLKRAYPKSEARPGPAPWSDEERAALEARYAADLTELASMEGVTLL